MVLVVQVVGGAWVVGGAPEDPVVNRVFVRCGCSLQAVQNWLRVVEMDHVVQGFRFRQGAMYCGASPLVPVALVYV